MINQIKKANLVLRDQSQVCSFGVYLGKKIRFHKMDKLEVVHPLLCTRSP